MMYCPVFLFLVKNPFDYFAFVSGAFRDTVVVKKKKLKAKLI